jgi:predicted amidophosphoribosyltransferase
MPPDAGSPAVPPPPPVGPAAGACPFCHGPVTADAARCPDCGMSLAGVDGRPGPFSHRDLWLWAAALLALYLVVLAIVVAAD